MAVTSGIRVLLLALILIAAPDPARGQEATREEMNHDFIFDLSGIPRQDIYDRTMRWITNNIRAPKAVIQSEDPETGTIVANGVTTMIPDGDSLAVGLSFRLGVDVREGKERVRFLNLQTSRSADEGWDQIPGEGAWHRGAQKRFNVMAHALNEYVKLK